LGLYPTRIRLRGFFLRAAMCLFRLQNQPATDCLAGHLESVLTSMSVPAKFFLSRRQLSHDVVDHRPSLFSFVMQSGHHFTVLLMLLRMHLLAGQFYGVCLDAPRLSQQLVSLADRT
jgi:hypothetical protein